MALLHIRDLAGTRVVPLKGPVMTFGRAEGNGLPLNGAGISRFHGRLSLAHGAWTVEDLGSLNGVLLNGRRVDRARLHAGDVLLVGSVQLTYMDAGEQRRLRQAVTITTEPLQAPLVVDRTAGDVSTLDARRLALLCGISRRLLDQHDARGLAVVAAEAMAAVLQAEYIVFGLTTEPQRQPDRVIVWPRDAEGCCISNSVLNRALQAGESVLVNDTSANEALASTQSIVSSGTRSVVCVPLRGDRGICGFIYAASRMTGRDCSEADLGFAAAVGAMVGTAVENARLREAEAQRLRMEAELASAREVQRQILPSTWVRPDNWEIAGRHVPSREVGGDYYDAILDEAGRLWLVIADVCGKGVPGALLASAVHAAVHTLVDQCTGPGELLARMNRLLLKRANDSRFVTCLAALVDVASGAVRVATAGHHAPVFASPGSPAATLPVKTAPPLGLFDDADYRETTWTFPESGGVLVFYTDGVTETFDPAKDMYGEERLLAACTAAADHAPAELLDHLHADVTRFRGPREQPDDLTLLACARTPNV